MEFFYFAIETSAKFRCFLNQILLFELQLSCLIYFSLNNFDKNFLTYDIQNNNYFLFFYFDMHTLVARLRVELIV